MVLVHCVGDTVTPTDAGNDATIDAPAQTDAGPDADASAPCTLPDAAPGSIDLGFTVGVKTITSAFRPRAAAVDPKTGSIYVAGYATQCVSAISGGDFALVLIDNDGTVDPGFNPGGQPRCVDFRDGVADGGVDDTFAVAVLPSGSALLAGSLGHASGTSHFGGGALAALRDGSLDPAFNTIGTRVTGPSEPDASLGIDAAPTGGAISAGFTTIFGLAVSPNKIAIVGSNVVQDTFYNAIGTVGFVQIINKDGTDDPNFNGGAPIADPVAGGFFGAAFDPAGNVVIVGQSNDAPGSQKMLVRRVSPDGKTVDAQQSITAPGGYIGRAVAILQDGHIALSGASNLQGTTYTGTLTVSMLKSDGSIESGFNGGQPFVTPLFTDAYLQFSSLATLCNGSLLVTGRYDIPPDAGDAGGEVQDMALVKVLPNGILDTAFGTGGVARQPNNFAQIPVGAAQDPITGKVVVIGRDTKPNLVMTRFNP